MKTIYIIPIILVMLIFSSCIKILDFNEKYFDPQLVANCVLNSDSTFSVNLTMSNSILEDENYTKVKDASIKLFENENLVVDIPLGTNKTYSDFKPIKNADYRIEIEAKNNRLTSYTSIPEPVNIVKIDTAYINNNSQYNDISKKLKFFVTIDDPGNEENYYRLFFRQTYYERDFFGYGESKFELKNDMVYVELNDPVFEENEVEESIVDVGFYNEYQVFSDQLFNGQQKEIDITFSQVGDFLWFIGDEGIDSVTGKDTLLLKVDVEAYIVSLSKEAFLYYKSRNAYNSTIEDQFVEPVPIYTNVNNGLGIFMGQAVTKYQFQVNQRKLYEED